MDKSSSFKVQHTKHIAVHSEHPLLCEQSSDSDRRQASILRSKREHEATTAKIALRPIRRRLPRKTPPVQNQPFMDLPRNLHDCYFFYYSTCKKGTNCEYRHEPAALGHEETCKLWQEGKCYNRTCTMRHMKIEKPRSATPCFWEDQPGGCRKPHCVFQHKAPKPQQAPTAAPHPATTSSMMSQVAAAQAQAQAAGAPTAATATPGTTPHMMHTTSPAVVLDYNYATLLPRII